MSNVTISDTLYHFTGFGGVGGTSNDEAFETLLKILKSSHLKLCRNEIAWGYQDSDGKKISGISFAPYMTCFTETPLEFSDAHTRDFGKFGIGFKVDWVISKKGQNVVYVRDGRVNNLGEAISRMLMHLTIDKRSPEFPRKCMHEIIYATENMKWRHEREWRIINDKPDCVAEFGVADIDCLICLESHVPQLQKFLESEKGLAGLRSRIKTVGLVGPKS
jgi:hypothetical protein